MMKRPLFYNKKSLLSFTILNFIFVFSIFSIVYFFIDNISPIFSMSNKLNDNFVYCYNNKYVEKYYNEEELDETLLYKFDYIENSNGRYSTIIYMNVEAAKYGFPSLGEFITFHYIDLSNLPMDKIITSNLNEITKDNVYFNFNPNLKIDTLFINYEFNVEYICISNDYINENGYDYSIYKNENNKLKSYSFYNTTNNDSYCYSGKSLKQQNLDSSKSMIKLFIFISLFPLAYAFLSIINLINYFLKKEKNIILIQRIYYKKKSEVMMNYFLKIISIIVLSSSIALVIDMFIFKNFDILTMMLSLIAITILGMCFVYFTLKKYVDKVYNTIEWEEIYD